MKTKVVEHFPRIAHCDPMTLAVSQLVSDFQDISKAARYFRKQITFSNYLFGLRVAVAAIAPQPDFLVR